MKRADIFDLVWHATSAGLTTAMTPSATPLVTKEAIKRLKDAGISRLAVSLDGANATTHDVFRGVPGSFDRTMEILSNAEDVGLTTQINTTVTRRNLSQIDEIADLIASKHIVLWSVFLLVPVGRGLAEQRIRPHQYEEVFDVLWRQSQKQQYAIKTTEAHHYRRFALQRLGIDPDANGSNLPSQGSRVASQPIKDRIQRAPLGVNDGKGCMFVSHTGAVYPSGFMPISAGKFPRQSIVDVYQHSEIFKALRNPDLLEGKCGQCEYRTICGGSRARAFCVTRNPLAAEPDCVYIPTALRTESSC